MEGLVRHARRSATSARRRAACASTTRWASRPSARADPDLDVEVIALRRRVPAVARPARWRLVLNFMGTPADRAALRRRARRRGSRDRAGDLAPERRREGRGPPAARPRLQARRDPGRAGRRAPHGRRPRRRVGRPRRAGAGRPAPRSASSSSSTPTSCAASTTTRTRSSSSRATRSATRSRRCSAAVATTASSSSSAASPPPASASAAGSSGSCSPATPRAPSRRRRPRVDCFVIDTTGGDTAVTLTQALRDAGLSADRGYDGRSMKSQMKSADHSGRPAARSSSATTSWPPAPSPCATSRTSDQTDVAVDDVVDHIRKALTP